jgi:ABC-type branched-subunit amino acid transport system substrate-binding protein
MGTCGCRDLTVSAAPEDQALIHGYQLASGLDPGPYVAEGDDAGRMVLAMLDGGEPSRASMADALSSMGSFQGIARTYTFDAEGDLATPIVRIYRAEGVRWLPVRDD